MASSNAEEEHRIHLNTTRLEDEGQHNLSSPSLTPLASRQASEHQLLVEEEDAQATFLLGDDSSQLSSSAAETSAEGLLKARVLDNISKTAAKRRSGTTTANRLHRSASLDENTSNNNFFSNIPMPYNINNEYQRITISESNDDIDPETAEICKSLAACLDIRTKWMNAMNCNTREEEDAIWPVTYDGTSKQEGRRRQSVTYNPFDKEVVPASSSRTQSDDKFEMRNGVVYVTTTTADSDNAPAVPSVDEFYKDYFTLHKLIHSGPAKTLAYKRLRVLESRFKLHTLLNADRELLAQKSVPHRDFYNVRKVDTHVHHSACMNQKHLLRFIKSKLKNSPDELVIFRDGRFMTLAEVFSSLNLTAYDLSVDTLDCHANNTFHRFDRFNLKYNPAGQSRLREIFLKTDNLMGGKYLADITKEVMSDLESSKYQLVEWRVSIYGRNHSEWEKLSKWFYVNRLSSDHVRWMIQVPRLYYIYKSAGMVESFQDMLDNIFLPMFEVTKNPESNPSLFCFLNTIVGFDCVDDESKLETSRASSSLPIPSEWTSRDNPPYEYWAYYLYANIASLNTYRKSKGLSTFTFRPHCGEAGDPDHLAAGFLTANGINHGITLRKSVVMQYLYYLSQIGIAMSPLSNNKLFLDYHRNPFPSYFAVGMNVSLSSDDPLMLHFTKDALVEEYSVAAQVWKLSSTDVCEIARYSVLQSGFEHPFKAHFLGEGYHKNLDGSDKECVNGNDIRMTNVPDIRIMYRQETLDNELREAHDIVIIRNLGLMYSQSTRRLADINSKVELAKNDKLGFRTTKHVWYSNTFVVYEPVPNGKIQYCNPSSLKWDSLPQLPTRKEGETAVQLYVNILNELVAVLYADGGGLLGTKQEHYKATEYTLYNSEWVKGAKKQFLKCLIPIGVIPMH